MKNYLSLFLLMVALFVNSCTNGQTQDSKTNLTPKEFSEKIKETSNAQVIDVRSPEEYSNGHIANAKNFNWNCKIFEKQIKKLDKSKPVFVYCLSGGRSAAAANKMRQSGFKLVYELSGGIKKWQEASLPVEK